MYNPKIMKECQIKASITSIHGRGGPFGAAVVKNGEIISIHSNSVISSKDPTAHAEVNAIRQACIKLGTYNLSDCELYATGFPCPMCLGAIMWANIQKVYISGLLEDAEKIGFKDDFIYKTIDKINKMCYNNSVVDLEFHDREIAQELYKTYQENQGTIY